MPVAAGTREAPLPERVDAPRWIRVRCNAKPPPVMAPEHAGPAARIHQQVDLLALTW